MKKTYIFTLALCVAFSASCKETQSANQLVKKLGMMQDEIRELLTKLHENYNELSYANPDNSSSACTLCNEKMTSVAAQIGDLAERLYQLELRLVYLEEDLNGTRLVIGEPGEEVFSDALATVEDINNAQLSVLQWLKLIYAEQKKLKN